MPYTFFLESEKTQTYLVQRDVCYGFIALSLLGNIVVRTGFQSRVATVREKYLENEIFSRSEKSQGILWMAREI